jgi:hypothetical protein
VRAAQGASSADGPDGVLTPVSRMLGVEGRAVTTPPVGTLLPAQRLPFVVLIAAALTATLVGPRFGAAALVLWLVLAGQPGRGAPAARPAAPGTGTALGSAPR